MFGVYRRICILYLKQCKRLLTKVFRIYTEPSAWSVFDAFRAIVHEPLLSVKLNEPHSDVKEHKRLHPSTFRVSVSEMTLTKKDPWERS